MADATENLGLFKYNPINDAKKKFNITNALNENWDKLDRFSKQVNYIKGCVNSGPVDENGEPAILSYDETTRTITVNAPFVYTTYSGKTYECNENLSAVIDENLTGTIRFWIGRNESDEFFVETLTNSIYIQKSEPQDAILNDVWVDTSVAPETSKRKTANGWEIYEAVEIGAMTGFTGGGNLMLNPYNASRFLPKTDFEDYKVLVNRALVNRADINLSNTTKTANTKMAHSAMPSKTKVSNIFGSSLTTAYKSYTAPADGFIDIVASSDEYNALVVQINSAQVCWEGTAAVGKSRNTFNRAVSKGDVIQARCDTRTSDTLLSYFFYANGAL